MRSDARDPKVLIVTFFSLHNFVCHKLAHCIHTLKPFVPRFIFTEITSSQSIHLLPRDTLLQKPCLPHNLHQLCNKSLLNNFEKVAN